MTEWNGRGLPTLQPKYLYVDRGWRPSKNIKIFESLCTNKTVKDEPEWVQTHLSRNTPFPADFVTPVDKIQSFILQKNWANWQMINLCLWVAFQNLLDFKVIGLIFCYNLIVLRCF